METLQFRFESGSRPLAGTPQLVGVVGSGNLEVLIGVRLGASWEGGMADFHARWQLADARISINDMGATPAVVGLRLDQAVESLTGGTP